MNINELNRLAQLVNGKAWGADYGKPRIYFGQKRDRKVFVSFEDFDGTKLAGSKFNCYIDDCGQHPNWYAGQRKAEAAGYREAMYIILAATNDEDSERFWTKAGSLSGIDLDDLEEDQLSDFVTLMTHGRASEAYAKIGI